MVKKICPYCGLEVTRLQVETEEAFQISEDVFAHDECITLDFESRMRKGQKELADWVQEQVAALKADQE